MARITRKELKSDRFALEVEHTVSFFEEHGKELARYGGIALAIVALIIGYTYYARHQRTVRQTALTDAIAASDAPVGAAAQPGALSFPTDQAKEQETFKRFNDIVSKYSGSDEGLIAQYYLGSFRAAQGNYAEAEKHLNAASQKSGNYASLAKLALAQVYFGEGRAAEGEKVLRELMDNPSLFVSKDQAAITLARQLAPVKPAEARKLLEPMLKAPGSTGQVASALDAEIPR